MTTATLVTHVRTMDTAVVRPRRSLEELVDRLIDALFAAPETETAEQSATRSIHEARRLRQSGDVDTALAVLGDVNVGEGHAEGGSVGLLRVEAVGQAAVHWPGRAALQPGHRQGRRGGAPGRRRAAGGCRGPGDAVEAGQGRLGAQPPGAEAPERRCVMVTANVDIPALKARHPLGDTVEASGVRLRGRGRVRQGVCPFHDEAEGSFTVYADSERFYCFGCGEGGDVLDFVRRMEDLTLPEAIARLDGSPGLAPRAAIRPARARRPASAALPPRDPSLLTAAARFYAGRLRRSTEAREYLASRGVGPVAAARLGLGYAPGGGLRQALESLGFPAGRVRDSGLFMERGAERFAGMVVVPDASGGLVRWLAGRALDPDVKPRFQALPGPKPVLGLGRLGPAPPWAVVAEGLFDWLALTGWGIPACAALGTQGVERVASALRGCPRILLAFDSDDAGREATERLLTLLGRRAAAVTLPQGVGDVGELAALPQGHAAFLTLLSLAARSAR